MKIFKNKIKNIKIILPILLLSIFVWMGMGEMVHAQAEAIGAAWQLMTGDGNVLYSGILAILATLAYSLLQLSATFLTICGTLLNIGINLTVHLDIFIRNNDIIFTIWSTIRDLSSMLLIFFILYSAIQMMIGRESAGYGNMIKNIIIAGVLINFSFFFARVLIDASNIISLQFYNAITPSNDVQYLPNDTLGNVMSKVIKNGSGGVSGIFSGALGVNQWWSDKSVFKTASVNGNHNTNLLTGIMLSNYVGFIVQIITGLSFLAAAIAVLWRSIILVFLIGFSPIWIASFAMPQLKDFRDEWWGPFKSNLIFLPVYMVFMYVSVLIISKSNLNSLVVNLSNSSGNATENYIYLFMAFAVIIFMLNIPLVVAFRASKLKLAWAESLQKSMAGFTKWATLGAAGGIAGWAGRKTIGRGAASAEEWAGNQKFGSAPAKFAGSLVGVGNSALARGIRGATISKVAQSKFGGSKSWKDDTTLDKEIKKKDKEIERLKRIENIISSGGTIDDFKEAVGKMTEKEKLSLSPKILKDIRVLKHLKKSDFEAIKKADDEDISPADRDEIKKGRILALSDAINNRESEVTDSMLRSLEPEDLVKFLNTTYGSTTEVPDVVIENLTRGTLEAIGKEKIDTGVKKKIGRKVYEWDVTHGKTHPGEGLVSKNLTEWTGIARP